MEGSRFDDLVRASATSRRGLLKLLAASIGAGLGIPRPGMAADKPFKRAGKSCAQGQECGELAPCTNGVCTPVACLIGGAIYQGTEPNPDNTCQFCIPTLDNWTDWLGVMADGNLCTTGAGPCNSSSGTCSSAVCVPEILADGTSCGPDQVCCSGDCCASGQCCGANGVCESCFTGCEIDGIRYEANAPHPTIDCLSCNPDVSDSTWSAVSDDTACGGVSGRFCCNGACCAPTECCSDAGACVDCFDGCLIDNSPVDSYTGHPTNDCLWCDPDVNENDWSPVPDQGICGGVAGRVCCNGECCAPDECCNGVACEFCGPHCRIGGEDIDAGTSNPLNACEVCDPGRDVANWSIADNDTACGPTGGQVCCNGECCPDNQCCNGNDGCGACFCQIGLVLVPDGTFNSQNVCQVCDYDRNPSDWSPRFEAAPCGDNLDRECCLGVCCPSGECCQLGECAPCPCEIGNETVDPGEFNRSNSCQYCDPDIDRFNWTTLGDDEQCDGLPNQVCCGGICCPPGECCVDGQCVTCPCLIGDDEVVAGTINDFNSCQICDPARNLTDWSPVDEGTACGPEEGQTCCSGECCAAGECCILDACGPCLCTIGTETFNQDDRNTVVDCQVCDARRDPFGWSEAEDDEPCLPESELVCCSGQCCAENQCCDDGQCGDCVCTIGEATIPNGDHNPANDCEVCSPRENPEGWTVEPDGAACGPLLSQECCSGQCCAEGECCTGGACAACTCAIDGISVPAGDHNLANDCEVCSPQENPNGWTVEPDGAACGPTLSMECCGGTCQPSCLPLGCIIEGVFYPHGQVNPNNFCEFCDAAVPTQWSPVRDNLECPEPCFIDGAWVPGGTKNPDNECECCAPHLSETEWSPCDWLLCGVSEDQHCCNSVCCAVDECCGDTNACTNVDCPPDACTINGAAFQDGEENPVNSCEYCNLASSATSWTAKAPNAACGANGEQFCCNGQCCELGVCCNPSTLTCDPARCGLCVIDGRVYDSGDRNPANLCQWCNPFVSTTSWSFVTANFYCDQPNRQGACCNGFCCATGMFCRTSDFSCQPLSA